MVKQMFFLYGLSGMRATDALPIDKLITL